MCTKKNDQFSMEISPATAEEEALFGPRETPAHAWRRAFSLTILIEFLITGFMAGFPEFALPQHTRPIPVQNVNGTWVRAWMLDNAYNSDTIPNWALMVIAAVVPFGVAIFLSFASPSKGAVKAWLHSFVWMMGTQVMIVGCLKAYCGYWRPYFLNECAFDDAEGRCTAEDYEHGFRSFPSGHASTSVGPLLHTTLRLMGALRVGHTPRAVRFGPSKKFVLELDGLLTMACLLPILLAIWIAGSRVFDHAHHPADIVGGALIGGSSAVMWYLRYFQPLFGPGSHKARRQ